MISGYVDRYEYIMKWQPIVIPFSLQDTPLSSFVKSPFQAEVVISYGWVKNGIIMCPEGLQLHSPSHEYTGVKCRAEHHGCKQFRRNNASHQLMYQLYKLISGLTLLSSLFLLFIIQLNAKKNLQFDNLFIQQYIKKMVRHNIESIIILLQIIFHVYIAYAKGCETHLFNLSLI